MNIRYNAGLTRNNMVGKLDGYGTVWYNPKGIANILSLSQVEKKHCQTCDNAASKAFVVHKNDGSKRRFEQAKIGLFYLDTEQSSNTVLVNTVDKIKSRYTNHDYQRALLARKIQNTVGRPLIFVPLIAYLSSRTSCTVELTFATPLMLPFIKKALKIAASTQQVLKSSVHSGRLSTPILLKRSISVTRHSR